MPDASWQGRQELAQMVVHTLEMAGAGESANIKYACRVGPDSLLGDRRVVTSFLALFVITPMCFPRRLGALAWVSMAAVIGFLYTAVIIVIRGWQIALDRCALFPAPEIGGSKYCTVRVPLSLDFDHGEFRQKPACLNPGVEQMSLAACCFLVLPSRINLRQSQAGAWGAALCRRLA